MSTCLRLPIASLAHPSSSSPSPSLQRRPFRTHCILPRQRGKAKPPLPPMDITNDPFLSRLASVAANSPERLTRPTDPDSLPFLDIFDSVNMAASAEEESSGSYYGRRSRSPPPNLASILLDERIIYIGLPLVPIVTELVVAQLFYLHYMDPKEPIALYINSTGTTRDDGQPIALESEGFAIYDCLMQFRKTEIRTVGIGYALNHACLFLAMGTKGKRFAYPHLTMKIQEPKAPSSGLVQTSDALISAKELLHNRDMFIRKFARHTGNSEEVVAEKMARGYFMNAREAMKFGVIDKIIWRGQEDYMKYLLPPEEWVTTDAKAKAVDD